MALSPAAIRNPLRTSLHINRDVTSARAAQAAGNSPVRARTAAAGVGAAGRAEGRGSAARFAAVDARALIRRPREAAVLADRAAHYLALEAAAVALAFFRLAVAQLRQVRGRGHKRIATGQGRLQSRIAMATEIPTAAAMPGLLGCLAWGTATPRPKSKGPGTSGSPAYALASAKQSRACPTSSSAARCAWAAARRPPAWGSE